MENELKDIIDVERELNGAANQIVYHNDTAMTRENRGRWIRIPPRLPIFIHEDLLRQLAALGQPEPKRALLSWIKIETDEIPYIRWGSKEITYTLENGKEFTFVVDHVGNAVLAFALDFDPWHSPTKRTVKDTYSNGNTEKE
jgi:hypothetical protein